MPVPNIVYKSYDPSHDLLNLQDSPLNGFFKPKSVALIGASERAGSVGRSISENLRAGGFAGRIDSVNLKGEVILGRPSYKTVLALPEKPDLAIIATPAKTVPDIVAQCVEKGISSAVIISAGFKEIGLEGKKLEGEILRMAKGKIRLLGPNCLGLMSPHIGLNATFAHSMARTGNVAFLSQSGALCTAILDWSLQQSFGFSGFVSTGSMVDIGWGDLLDYFGADENTKSIVIYMESIGDARSFISAAREVSLNKPIIVIKAGRTEAAAKAAASHTGALTGSDAVLDAAFRRCGVLRVNEISQVFYLADILARQPLPKGNRLMVITNAGGPGVLATDALVSGGGMLAPLSGETLKKLNEFLPAAWSHGDPIDILGDADAQRFASTMKHAIAEDSADGVLLIATPQGMTDPAEIAKQLIPYGKDSAKPILASWMGGAEMADGIASLNQAGIPTFPFPDVAASTFNDMWRFRQNLDMLYETSVDDGSAEDNPGLAASELLGQIRNSGRTLLTEFEAKQVLKLYGIPVVQTRVAKNADEAVTVAKEFGYPVALKINSETITHKSDIGGVQLNLDSEQAVRSAFQLIQKNVQTKASLRDFLGVTVQPMIKTSGYEIILGSSIDSQFGPVLLFGMGGTLVEVFKDHALALPPLTSTLARRMMEGTKIFAALKGVRGHKSVDMNLLEQILVRFSELVVNHPEISEIDINPLIASENGILALDARIVLHALDVKVLPRPAIRPYPTQYCGSFVAQNQEVISVRPIRPSDEQKIIDFHHLLSEQTVYARYLKPFHLSERVTHQRLTRICFIDYDREMALVALNSSSRGRAIVAVARLKKSLNRTRGEISVVVTDTMQRQGLGLELIKRLVEIAKEESLNEVSAFLKSDNTAMQAIFEKLGFSLMAVADGWLAACLKFR